MSGEEEEKKKQALSLKDSYCHEGSELFGHTSCGMPKSEQCHYCKPHSPCQFPECANMRLPFGCGYCEQHACSYQVKGFGQCRNPKREGKNHDVELGCIQHINGCDYCSEHHDECSHCHARYSVEKAADGKCPECQFIAVCLNPGCVDDRYPSTDYFYCKQHACGYIVKDVGQCRNPKRVGFNNDRVTGCNLHPFGCDYCVMHHSYCAQCRRHYPDNLIIEGKCLECQYQEKCLYKECDHSRIANCCDAHRSSRCEYCKDHHDVCSQCGGHFPLGKVIDSKCRNCRGVKRCMIPGCARQKTSCCKWHKEQGFVYCSDHHARCGKCGNRYPTKVVVGGACKRCRYDLIGVVN